MRGGVEAVFDDMPQPIGLLRFADHIAARGTMFSARQRARAANSVGLAGTPELSPPVTEDELEAPRLVV